jgi:cell division septal protein FtsQ
VDLNNLAERFSRRNGQESERKAGARSRLSGESRTRKIERMRRYEERFAPPPVMVRGERTGASLGSVPGDLVNFPAPGMKRSAKARKRYDVALGIPGAEMRLPALPEIHLGWRLLSGVLVAALLAALYYLWSSPDFKVQAAEVTGLQRLSQADVRAVLNIEEESIFTLQAAELQEKLEEAFPEFATVAVELGLPAKVSVTIEERQPILVWKQDGKEILVDANGISFPQRENAPPGPSLTVEAAAAPPQPVAADELDPDAPFMPVEMVSAIVSMSGQAPQGTPILYDKIHGLGWREPQGWEVYFGDVQDMGAKLNVYQAMLQHFKSEGIEPVLVSVEHVHAPYYRMEQ